MAWKTEYLTSRQFKHAMVFLSKQGYRFSSGESFKVNSLPRICRIADPNFGRKEIYFCAHEECPCVENPTCWAKDADVLPLNVFENLYNRIKKNEKNRIPNKPTQRR